MASGFNFVLILVAVSACNAVFQRIPCEGSCSFNFKGAGNPISLLCDYQVNSEVEHEQGLCICENDRHRRRADAPYFKVELQEDKCTVRNGAPCGISNGIELSCRGDSECLEGRCRDRSEFGKTPLNYSCLDSQDCEPGLVCKFTGFRYRRQYTCVTPDTPEYKFNTE